MHARTVAREPDDVTSTTCAALTPDGTEHVAADGCVVRLVVGDGRRDAARVGVRVAFGRAVRVVEGLAVVRRGAADAVVGETVVVTDAEGVGAAASPPEPQAASSAVAAPTTATRAEAALTTPRSAGSRDATTGRPTASRAT